ELCILVESHAISRFLDGTGVPWMAVGSGTPASADRSAAPSERHQNLARLCARPRGAGIRRPEYSLCPPASRGWTDRPRAAPGATEVSSAPQPDKVYRVLIIGAGFSGIGTAVRLRQRGEQDFVLYEKEAGIGGTWWVNQYPGCACDIPSHLYSFSFEPNPHWSRRFSPQPEIRDYLAHCANKYQLLPHIHFKREAASLRWLEKRALWQITDGAGQVVFARFVVAGTGALSTPDYPNIAGLQRFRGRVFHSQHW